MKERKKKEKKKKRKKKKEKKERKIEAEFRSCVKRVVALVPHSFPRPQY